MLIRQEIAEMQHRPISSFSEKDEVQLQEAFNYYIDSDDPIVIYEILPAIIALMEQYSHAHDIANDYADKTL